MTTPHEDDNVRDPTPGVEAVVKTETCEFVAASDIVPPALAPEFWSEFSENAPFSWGDNNRTLVTASRFYDHCKAALGDELQGPETDEFYALLEIMGETYIDLEN